MAPFSPAFLAAAPRLVLRRGASPQPLSAVRRRGAPTHRASPTATATTPRPSRAPRPAKSRRASSQRPASSRSSATAAIPRHDSEHDSPHARDGSNDDIPVASPVVQRLLDAGLPVVVLRPGKDRMFRVAAHTTIFSGAVAHTLAPPSPPYPPRAGPLAGDAVAVVDSSHTSIIGLGFFNPYSMFRVRLLETDAAAIAAVAATADAQRAEETEDATAHEQAWDIGAAVARRVVIAVALRETLGLPAPDGHTDVFRVVNSDGDRMSGLVVDRVGPSALVVSTSALWAERYRGAITAALQDAVQTPSGEGVQIVWRHNGDRLRQDGLARLTPEERDLFGVDGDGDDDVAAADADAAHGHSEAQEEEEEESVSVVFENGVRFAIPARALRSGQKTGHYADQRENRLLLRHMLAARTRPTRVLDLYCYTGGFALSAALAGAHVHVTGVDSSVDALAMGARNAELNGVDGQIEWVRDDVSKWLRSRVEAARATDSGSEGAGEDGGAEDGLFDVVVVDPPKFAPSVKNLERALRKYHSLNEAAVRSVRRGGLLVTCSCSAAVTREREAFVELVRDAARQAGRELQVIKVAGAAGDHPVIPEMMETEYLTMCVFAVR